jgi:hypothetical protein
VLSRKTRPPVDLYCFYLFLQREGAEDTLDFWLDVQQHENLCRAYFKDLRKSGRQIREDWPQYYELARNRGSIYNNINGITRQRLDGIGEKSGDDHGQQAGQPSLSFSGEHTSFDEKSRHARPSLGVEDLRDNQRTPSPSSRPDYTANFSPTMRALYPNDLPSPTEQGQAGRYSISSRRSRPRESALPFIPRDSAISRTDLIASAERIFARYLLTGAEKEIYLPPALRIHSFPLSSGQLPATTSPQYDVESEAIARIPDMFHSQKEYVYRAMEQDSFPRFLRSRAFGNLTPISALVRLVFGLFSLWAGLSTAFSFVFLNYTPKTKRLWVSQNL